MLRYGQHNDLFTYTSGEWGANQAALYQELTVQHGQFDLCHTDVLYKNVSMCLVYGFLINHYISDYPSIPTKYVCPVAQFWSKRGQEQHPTFANTPSVHALRLKQISYFK